MCILAFFVFLGEPYRGLPGPGLGHCDVVFCVLQEFYTFYLMVAFFAKPSSKWFWHPFTFPIPHCWVPCPDPENVDFTSVYDRFWGVAFPGLAVWETSRFCFAMFLHWGPFGCYGFLRWEMKVHVDTISHVLPHGSSFCIVFPKCLQRTEPWPDGLSPGERLPSEQGDLAPIGPHDARAALWQCFALFM